MKLEKDVEKRFDEEFNVEPVFDSIDGKQIETVFGNAINNDPSPNEVKQFLTQEIQTAVEKERERIITWCNETNEKAWGCIVPEKRDEYRKKGTVLNKLIRHLKNLNTKDTKDVV